jgi:hypothetical protein
MALCYSCESQITKSNESEEHIIINALGGRLKSRKLLCSSCNNSLGGKYDAALAKALNILANNLDIKRERGKVPSQIGKVSKSGDPIAVEAGGKPKLIKTKIEENLIDGKLEIKVSAPDKRAAKKALKGLQRKHGLSDEEIQRLIDQMEFQEYKLDDHIHHSVQIGGNEVLKAVLKTAINYYVHEIGEFFQVKEAIEELNASDEETDRVWFLNHAEDLPKYNNREIMNVLRLKGCPDSKNLICLVDFFSTAQYGVLLSESYSGPKIDKVYSFDLIDNKELTGMGFGLYCDEAIKAKIMKKETDYESLYLRFSRFS